MSLAPCEATPDEAVFLDWLLQNGALFPKIKWPVLNAKSGLRGAVAIADISRDEVMLSIPKKLLLCPETAQQSELGAILPRHPGVTGDTAVAFQLLFERAKGKRSFYGPYIDVLPQPSPLSSWDASDMRELQDYRLVRRARGRRNAIQYRYERFVVPLLEQEDHELLTTQHFSLDKFVWAWNVVASRAFGRRLPWVALVPFADCLNHANVQTKYDYDVTEDADDAELSNSLEFSLLDAEATQREAQQGRSGRGNGLFRMFPTGTTQYAKGSEVFNSYGRRPNDNLLMEYGFAMLFNEWDEVQVHISLFDELRRQAQLAASEASDASPSDIGDAVDSFREAFRRRLVKQNGRETFDLRLAVPDVGFLAFARSCQFAGKEAAAASLATPDPALAETKLVDSEVLLRDASGASSHGVAVQIPRESMMERRENPVSITNEIGALNTCLRAIHEAELDFGMGSDLEADFRLLDRLSRRLRDGTLSAEPTIDPEAGESSNDQHDLEKYCNALAYRITRKAILRTWTVVLDAILGVLVSCDSLDDAPQRAEFLGSFDSTLHLVQSFWRRAPEHSAVREMEDRFVREFCAHADFCHHHEKLLAMVQDEDEAAAQSL